MGTDLTPSDVRSPVANEGKRTYGGRPISVVIGTKRTYWAGLFMPVGREVNRKWLTDRQPTRLIHIGHLPPWTCIENCLRSGREQ